MSTKRGYFNVKTLNSEQRKRVWEWVQQNQPDLAEFLEGPGFAHLRDDLAGVLYLPENVIKEALQCQQLPSPQTSR